MIANAASMIAPDGRAYFLIYEGDRSDAGRVTKTVGGNPESWQNNRPAESTWPRSGRHSARSPGRSDPGPYAAVTGFAGWVVDRSPRPRHSLGFWKL